MPIPVRAVVGAAASILDDRLRRLRPTPGSATSRDTLARDVAELRELHADRHHRLRGLPEVDAALAGYLLAWCGGQTQMIEDIRRRLDKLGLPALGRDIDGYAPVVGVAVGAKV